MADVVPMVVLPDTHHAYTTDVFTAPVTTLSDPVDTCTCTWDWGDGSAQDTVGNCTTVRAWIAHTRPGASVHAATLTVSGASGATELTI